MPLAIRVFHPADFETLWRIDQECFPPGISYSRRELKSYVTDSRSFTLVASEGREKDVVRGFIVANLGPVGHIITIDVVPAHRRNGVGSLLLQAAEKRLREASSSAVRLETAVDNLDALSFYKRHSYNVIGTRPRYYPNGVDALVLTKDLASGSPEASAATKD
ncbi:MAG TPA: GNAT family N-acetyltransferase [Candidatus Solibacter sp.]|nr:GNAT family N-acetyltransferase [Candidatus Solibacter sp.]